MQTPPPLPYVNRSGRADTGAYTFHHSARQMLPRSDNEPRPAPHTPGDI